MPYFFSARASATYAPVMLAVRVPPSAWITSQSTVIVRSPSLAMSTTPRSDAADQALDLVRPPTDAARARLALAALGAGARQHAVLGGDPALTLAAQPARHAILDGHGADHPRVADPDQDRSLGELEIVGHDLDGPQLGGGASVGPASGGDRHCRRFYAEREPGRSAGLIGLPQEDVIRVAEPVALERPRR